jgi:hypothetical protein
VLAGRVSGLFFAMLLAFLPVYTESIMILKEKEARREMSNTTTSTLFTFPQSLNDPFTLQNSLPSDPFVDVLTLEQFLAAYEDNPKSIELARVLPPQLGSEGFGKVLVRRKFPVFIIDHP